MLITTPVFAAKYYCGDPNGYDISYLYDTDSDCEVWNTSFWKEINPEYYSNCKQQRIKLKQMHQKGECKPVIERNIIENGKNCTIEFVSGTNQRVSTSCFSR